jgi:hypothetical protein
LVVIGSAERGLRVSDEVKLSHGGIGSYRRGGTGAAVNPRPRHQQVVPPGAL